MNVVVLQGALTRSPEWRDLPSGVAVVSYEVTTRDERGEACSVPVSWFDPPAGAVGFEAGDEIVVSGRVRRRFFRAGGVTQSRTELIADAVVASRQAKRARALVAAAARRLQ
ncbi:MAG: single-stranded DNA-binding protein [Acidimicrobiia bacterium]